MKTKIFAYKNYLGIESSEDAEGMIAKPGNGNIGVVVMTGSCEITPEAKGMLKNAKREGGSFAPFMLTKHADPDAGFGKSSFGWLGSYIAGAPASEVLVGRDCNKEVLDDMIEVKDMVLPEGFIQFVDSEK